MGAAVKKAEVMIPGDGGRAERLRFTMDAGLLKDVYVHDYVWSADGLTVAWELVEGHKRRAAKGHHGHRAQRAQAQGGTAGLILCSQASQLRSIVGFFRWWAGPQADH